MEKVLNLSITKEILTKALTVAFHHGKFQTVIWIINQSQTKSAYDSYFIKLKSFFTESHYDIIFIKTITTTTTKEMIK